MIISFPSPLMEFEVTRPVPKDRPTQYAHVVGHRPPVFVSPINLKPDDRVWMDIRDSQVYIVERAGIAIWRSGWQN